MTINSFESILLRNNITNAYRMDETMCVNHLIPLATFSHNKLEKISTIARKLVTQSRELASKQNKIEALLHHYDLSTNEGISLMCLAEALLRIPDKPTMDKLIGDKISTMEWKNHLNQQQSLFVNATTWSLLLSGKIYSPTLSHQQTLMNSLKRGISHLGTSMVRPFILQMMKTIGKQFILGETIESALVTAKELEKKGYMFSYDMLGEAARTQEDATHYYNAYVHAIEKMGQTSHADHPIKNPGISVKLSALHPRYEFAQRERVLAEIPELVLSLLEKAKKYNLGFVIDAEEADRLDLSLDIFELLFSNVALQGWEGFGLAVQAYQKRAPFVIDWLSDLSKRYQRRIIVRLVKGAYWDAEIKTSQIQGLSGYPVFTRKSTTDVSYIACANKLLSLPHCFYPQFGTHNAYSIAAVLALAGEGREFEFQCLRGMGQGLYDQIIHDYQSHLRIYAPVGTHRDLLGYLVRRLLENGASNSFVNRLADPTIPIEKIIEDPVKKLRSFPSTPNPQIPLPKDIYKDWQNAEGIDLSNTKKVASLQSTIKKNANEKLNAAPIINGKFNLTQPEPVFSPSDLDKMIGYVHNADDNDIEKAIQMATDAFKSWSRLDVFERATLLESAGKLLHEEMDNLISLLVREGGRCIPDALSEVREAIDYCYYYAYRARQDLTPITLPGPTGENNELSLHPRGLFACISPWNFPLAIFMGQISAALVVGNTVIAKPAEQTPLIAFKVIQLLHQAGIHKNALQLLTGHGNVGARLVKDSRVNGVLFTGSTETAKLIEQSLAHRPGPIATFIAETGGLNAMIVDSSALLEQTIVDITQSAFNSAGQRCSALRILFVQEEIATRLLNMLKGYMEELIVGNPHLLSTDIGPLIDKNALQMIQKHFNHLKNSAQLIAQTPLQNALNGYYFAPCAFELENPQAIKREIFGPILPVVRFKASSLDKVLETIIQTGYGLTLGIHSRIDATINYIVNRMPIGNIYINRNMIGAVVGVQPFGGQGLSGTGPKAGGPHYLPRLCVEKTISTNTTAVGGNARLISLLEDNE